MLVSSDGGPEARREAGRRAATAIEPLVDVQAGADYRRHLVRVMVERALAQAAA
jgi:carbon-monoxide dehydrogenase medium subunit